MLLQIKALNEEEFSAAVSGALVSGTCTKHTGKKVKTVYVNVLLGQRQPYENQTPKYADTKFKKFTGCSLDVFESLDDLHNGDIYSTPTDEVDVILFY